MGYIYILTSPNGKSYIGQTIRPIEKRFEEHQKKSSSCVAIYNAIKKYGWENIEKDWYYCPDEDLNKHEELMVEVLGTLSPNGYNLKEGGGNGKLSNETKQKMRERQLGENNSMYGKSPNEETKQKLREATSGKNNPMYGKKHTEEAKQKNREANSGENHPKSKRVYQYDLDGTFITSFGSAGEAGHHIEKDRSSIKKCARGKLKTAYNFKWSYTMTYSYN